MGLKVVNKSPQRVTMTNTGIFYTFDYGVIPFDSSGQIFIEITDETGDVKNLKVNSTCGCAIPHFEKEDNKYTVSIIYDTKRRGNFTKQIKVPYKEGFISKQLIFNITGTVQ